MTLLKEVLILSYPLVGALAFDIEYARWLEEHNRQINELRAAVNAHASDNELRITVDGVMAHYDDIFKIKSAGAKADVFHILSGMWKTPAERCFLWLGGFRSSELLKVSEYIFKYNYIFPRLEKNVVGTDTDKPCHGGVLSFRKFIIFF